MYDHKNDNMNSEVIKEISKIMLQLTGVQLLDKQSAMVHSRLTKRMIDIGVKDTAQYLKYLKENFSAESKILVSLLTTHHTFFFREFFHFEFLLKEGLKKVIDEVRSQKQNKIRILSAACSHGQEVYSLAMFLDYHLPQMAPDLTYEILGTDVDIDCIKIAKNGVYRFEQIKEIPAMYQADHWQKGTGDIASFVRIKDSIRKKCQFMTSNLFDMNTLMGHNFHLIFCRNVFIYFNQTQVASVSRNLLQLLSSNGYLFLGLSETLNGLSLPIEAVGPSVYHKPGRNVDLPKQEKTVSLEAAPILAEVKPLRVVCVDDSSIILTLLKKILVQENGFEVVGTASNGIEAHQMVESLKPDIVTLDIHMPKMSGVEYLKAHMSENHPPVVMISSVSREEAEFGVQSLELGASDFIEKPALATLQDKAEEIRVKLHCAVDFYKKHKTTKSLDLVKSFKSDLATAPSGVVRVCVGGIGDLQKIKLMLSDLGPQFPPFVILLHGAESFVPLFLEQLKSFPKKLFPITENTILMQNHIYLASFEKLSELQKMMSVNMPSHVFITGEVPEIVAEMIIDFKPTYVFLEEQTILSAKGTYQKLKSIANEVIPHTSMIYHSNRQWTEKLVA